MQVYIATYTSGHGDSFAAMNLHDVNNYLEEEHGGHMVTRIIDGNMNGSITWVDNCDCQFLVEVVTGELVGME